MKLVSSIEFRTSQLRWRTKWSWKKLLLSRFRPAMAVCESCFTCNIQTHSIGYSASFTAPVSFIPTRCCLIRNTLCILKIVFISLRFHQKTICTIHNMHIMRINDEMQTVIFDFQVILELLPRILILSTIGLLYDTKFHLKSKTQGTCFPAPRLSSWIQQCPADPKGYGNRKEKIRGENESAIYEQPGEKQFRKSTVVRPSFLPYVDCKGISLPKLLWKNSFNTSFVYLLLLTFIYSIDNSILRHRFNRRAADDQKMNSSTLELNALEQCSSACCVIDIILTWTKHQHCFLQSWIFQQYFPIMK